MYSALLYCTINSTLYSALLTCALKTILYIALHGVTSAVLSLWPLYALCSTPLPGFYSILHSRLQFMVSTVLYSASLYCLVSTQTFHRASRCNQTTRINVWSEHSTLGSFARPTRRRQEFLASFLSHILKKAEFWKIPGNRPSVVSLHSTLGWLRINDFKPS